MKKLALVLLTLVLTFSSAYGVLRPEEVISKFKEKFDRIKDAQADIVLDAGLQLFGCSGIQQWKGRGYYKNPDKIKVELGDAIYFANGNQIRKTEKSGKHYYVKLLNSLDFQAGFGPQLITENFNLTLIKETSREIAIEGIPKPGILKNAKIITFYFDPQEFLLRKIFVAFENKKFSGAIELDYKKIDGRFVPTSFHGKTAVEMAGSSLAGLLIRLNSKEISVNSGLLSALFDPGF